MSAPLLVRSPFDGALIAELESACPAEIDDALETASVLYGRRDQWLSPYERVGILDRTVRMMSADHGELTRLIALEGGKPIGDAHLEVTRAIESIRLCISHLTTCGEAAPLLGVHEQSAHRVALSRREPVGVVVAMSAFNYPLNQAVSQVAPAVAAGCPVVLAPAADTPLSGMRFVEYLHRAGLPEDWARSVVADNRTLLERLASDTRADLLTFVGAAAIGWRLRSLVAPGTRCLLEHGSAAPVIVGEDADLPAAAASIARGGYYHAGQDTVSTQRVFAPAANARELADLLAHRADALVVGNPLHADTDVGPLIRPSEVKRVAAWVDDAIAGGAELITRRASMGAHFRSPDVLLDPPETARVSREAIFGPVICVFGYETEKEAVSRSNALPDAFQATVFTTDVDRALALFQGLRASTVMLNDHTAFRADGMRFGGLGLAGLGTGGIPETLEAMRLRKQYIFHSAALG